MLVIFRGLPGTGKSTLVRQLVERCPGFLVLSRDVLRRALVLQPTWAEEEKDLVDELVRSLAGLLLDKGRDVVIDGMSLSSAAGVERLVQVAESRGAPFRIVECTCRQETALARIRADEGRHPAGDRGEALYFQVKARWQAIPWSCLAVDTERPADLALGEILRYALPS